MSQTDAENRLAVGDEVLNVFNDFHIVFGISGAVAQHDAVWIQSSDIIDRRVSRHNRHIAADLQQHSEDIVLVAVIHERDMVCAVFTGIEPALFLLGNHLYWIDHLIIPDLLQQRFFFS